MFKLSQQYIYNFNKTKMSDTYEQHLLHTNILKQWSSKKTNIIWMKCIEYPISLTFYFVTIIISKCDLFEYKTIDSLLRFVILNDGYMIKCLMGLCKKCIFYFTNYTVFIYIFS
jgi:hypothetical protein